MMVMIGVDKINGFKSNFETVNGGTEPVLRNMILKSGNRPLRSQYEYTEELKYVDDNQGLFIMLC